MRCLLCEKSIYWFQTQVQTVDEMPKKALHHDCIIKWLAEKILIDMDREYAEKRSIRDTFTEAAENAIELIEGYVDVVDGDYGQPRPNKAMQAQQVLQDAIDKARKL